MTELRVTLEDGRVLTVDPSLGTDSTMDAVGRPFAALVPAFDERDLEFARRVIGVLITRGCVELCCVGPRGEEAHDAVDNVIEDSSQYHVVTTWHVDLEEGCEYFLHVAGGQAKHLLALVGDRAELADAIGRIVPSARLRPRSGPLS